MFASLKGRILLGFGIVLLMLAGSTAMNVALLSGIASESGTFRSALARKSQAVDIDLVMQKVRVRVNQWLRSMNPDFAKQADELLVQDTALVARAAQDARSDKEKQIVAEMGQALQAYIVSWRVVQDLYAEEAKVYADRIVAPSAAITADLAKLRDSEGLDPRTSHIVGDARDGFLSAQTAAFRYRASMKQADADQLAAAISGALAALDQAGKAMRTPADTDLAKRTGAALTAWNEAFKDAVKVAQTKVARITSWTAKEGEAMAVGANALRAEGDTAATEGQSVLDATMSRSAVVLYALSGAILFVGVVLSLVLARGITRPLARITAALKGLAAGDNQSPIPETGRRDEIGDMAKAAQVFKDAAIEAQQAQEAAASDRRAADEERARNEAARDAATLEQQRVVGGIAGGLERLSEGDLTVRLESAFSVEYEKLRHDFNAAMETLQDVLREVTSTAAAVRAGSGEITTAADDLSRRTEHQAASLEETAAALDEITMTVRRTTDGTARAQSVVGTAKSGIERSGDVMQQAVSAMDGIEKSSGQIGQIIGVIDEIAFQTNLLALNAGVEAARAGDAGRGFAVVASEVRALAQRSAEAAKEIKTLINTSTNQVKTGVDMVSRAGQALGQILTQVTEIDSVVGSIASSAQEQATGLQEVNTAVNQMDQVTQQNAAMVEQSTAASHALAQQAEELARLTARFKVSGGTDQRKADPASTPRSGSRGTVTPLRRPPGRTRDVTTSGSAPTVHQAAGSAATARKLEPSQREEGWEDF